MCKEYLKLWYSKRYLYCTTSLMCNDCLASHPCWNTMGSSYNTEDIHKPKRESKKNNHHKNNFIFDNFPSCSCTLVSVFQTLRWLSGFQDIYSANNKCFILATIFQFSYTCVTSVMYTYKLATILSIYGIGNIIKFVTRTVKKCRL